MTTLSDVSDGTVTTIDTLIATPGSDGLISLREAIQAANNTSGPNTITFEVSGSLEPLTDLPALSDLTGGTTIDVGDKQIVLDGDAAGAALNGLFITSASNVISGLYILDFQAAGILISGLNAAGNQVRGCVIGAGVEAVGGNGAYGVALQGGAANNLIGGASSEFRNVIVGSGQAGVYIGDAGTSNNRLLGNLIGAQAKVAKQGAGNLTGVLVAFGASNNQIGDGTASGANFIYTNQYGIRVLGVETTGISIRRNAITLNEIKGISIEEGANRGILSPVIQAVSPVVSGTAPVGSTVEIYYDQGDQGQISLETVEADTNGSFAGTLDVSVLPLDYITATATTLQGDTSEFSAPFPLGNQTSGGTVCDFGSIFAQLPNRPNYTSSNDGASTVVYENFTGITSPIQRVRWWGITLRSPGGVGEACIRFNESYDISFFTEGAEGNLEFQQSFVVQATKRSTGVSHDDPNGAMPIYQYDAEFPQPVDMAEGWISIWGIIDNECRFFWAGSRDGDALAKVFDGSAFADQAFDYSLCLGGVPDNDCLALCPLNSPDRDGDGLSECEEACLGASDNSVDSDNDGIPDPFERNNGLDPTRDDANEDPDGDLLTNFEEYLLGSSPIDANSPNRFFYVGPAGIDTPGAGSQANPFRTIGFALNQAAALPVKAGERARVIVRAGLYIEDIALIQGVALHGAPGERVQIMGTIDAAPGALLANLEVLANGSEVLLYVNNMAMEVREVSFFGSAARSETGMLVDGAAAVDTLITDCTFSSLAVGIDIGGALPRIRRSIFENIVDAGIILRPESDPALNSLGSIEDPGSGWNTFRRSIEGFAIINGTGQPLETQQNDWETDSAAEIDAAISGQAVFAPALPMGSAILAASLYCRVWASANQSPVLKANLVLKVSSYAPVTQNVNGLYAYPSVPEGQYTLELSAPGFKTQSKSISLASGQTLSVAIPLEADGGAPPPPPPPAGFCQRTKSSEAVESWGDLSIIALFLLCLVAVPARRSKSPGEKLTRVEHP